MTLRSTYQWRLMICHGRRRRRHLSCWCLWQRKKKHGDIRARKVTDRSKQYTYHGYNKSDGPSQTTVTESIRMIGVIYAKEKREVAILDTVDPFLHVDNDKTINMVLRGKLDEIMVRIDTGNGWLTLQIMCPCSMWDCIKFYTECWGLLCCSLRGYEAPWKIWDLKLTLMALAWPILW